MTIPALDGTEMPPGIAALPQDWRGYPIPFIAGGTDFRIIDPERWHRCVGERLCAMCGLALGYWIAFVGDDRNVTGRIFIDPAMHPECARYSMAVCPFLVNPNARRSGRDLPADGSRYLTPHLRDRPEKMALYLTRSFEVVRGPIGSPHRLLIHVAPARSVEWF